MPLSLSLSLSLSFSLKVLGLHREDRKSGRWGYVSDKSVWFSAVWIIKSICADSDLNLLGSDAAGRIQGLGDACGAGEQLRWHYSTHAPDCLKQEAYHTQGQEMMDGWEWVSPRDMEHTEMSGCAPFTCRLHMCCTLLLYVSQVKGGRLNACPIILCRCVQHAYSSHLLYRLWSTFIHTM